MAITKPGPTTGLIWQSIAPSDTSGILCVFAGIVTVGIGVLQGATKQGTPVTSIDAGSGVNSSFIAGFDHLLSQGSWGDMLALIVLVLVLLVVLGFTEFLFGGFAGLRRASKEETADVTKLTASEWHWLLQRGRFRLLVGLGTIVVAIILMYLIHWASGAERSQVTFQQLSLKGAAWRMALAALIWALTYHATIVFIRLYTFRTRIFGAKEVY